MMGLFEHWPYVNFHELNLDWIIKEIPKVFTARDEAQESAEASAGSADRSEHQAANAATSALDAAQSALESAQSADDSQGSADAAAASEASAKNYADHIADPVSGLVTGWLDNHVTPTSPIVDDTLTIQGAAADAKKTGDEITHVTESLKLNVMSAESLLNFDELNNLETTLHGRIFKKEKNCVSIKYSADNATGRWYTALRNNAGFDYNTSVLNLAKAQTLDRFYKIPGHDNVTLVVKLHVTNRDGVSRKIPGLGVLYVTDVNDMTKNKAWQLWNDSTIETAVTYDNVLTFDISGCGEYFIPAIYSENSQQEVYCEITLTNAYDTRNLGYSIEEYNDSILWEYGIRNTASGAKSDSLYALRTKRAMYLPPGTIVSVDEGYKFSTIWYSETGEYISGDTYQTDPRVINYSYYTIGETPRNRLLYNLNLAKTDNTQIINLEDIAKHIHFKLPVNAMLNVTRDSLKVLNGYSRFNKQNINFTGLPIGAYYKGLGEAYAEGFNSSTTTATVISAFDDLLTNYGTDYMTKTVLGLCSDGVNNVIEYDLTPKAVEAPRRRTNAKVIIVSAQHGFEKNSVYGLYYFIRDLLTNWDKSPILDFIRNHITIKMIPIANPYGFDNNVYLNANGVNLNRNYDMPGWPADPDAQPGDDKYSGAAPFDQVETQYIRDLVLSNLDAFLAVDFHTNGRYSVNDWKSINWNSLVSSADPYYHHMFEASRYHIENITAHFEKDYSLPLGSAVCGYITGQTDHDSVSCTADAWFTAQGILGLTLEGFCGFKDMTAFSPDSQKANSELIGNYIISVMNTYSNLL